VAGKVIEAKSVSVLQMTVLVSIKINDGVVMAADSASSPKATPM
jgi:20S proteasome alpha/beta subunit